MKLELTYYDALHLSGTLAVYNRRLAERGDLDARSSELEVTVNRFIKRCQAEHGREAAALAAARAVNTVAFAAD